MRLALNIFEPTDRTQAKMFTSIAFLKDFLHKGPIPAVFAHLQLPLAIGFGIENQVKIFICKYPIYFAIPYFFKCV